MTFSLGQQFRLTVYGQSHAPAIGVVIDGLPAGIDFPQASIQATLERRRPGRLKESTPRQEADLFQVKSGIIAGKTCGAPICLEIANTDMRSRDYEQLKVLPRPSHADYPAQVKYQGAYDVSGGGHFSGRMTAPLVMAGAFACEILKQKGIDIFAHIQSIGDVEDVKLSMTHPDLEALEQVKMKEFPTLSDGQGQVMRQLIAQVKAQEDSIGGQVEVIATGLPVGLGQPLYDSCEAKIAHAIFGVPAIRGIEFGTGFEASSMRGSQHNDAYDLDDAGQIVTQTNHHGGVIGGLSTGMPLIYRVAVKPTSSIGQVQQTVNLETLERAELKVEGRHDPCIVPRVVPVLEAVTAICLLDLLMMEGTVL